MLEFLGNAASRLVAKSELYKSEKDADVQLDCIDIVTAKLNDFTQAFKDVVIFMREKENTYNGAESLRYCLTSYDTFEFEKTSNEEEFLKELLLRNEITHDYFNIEIHKNKLISLMEGPIAGALDVYENLQKYCEKHNLLEEYMNARR